MASVFDLYKPLRNHLRQVNITESLAVIRAYAQNLQFNQPLPSDIQVHPSFALARNKIDKGIYEWELEILAKEILINGTESRPLKPQYTLRRWDYLAKALNRLRLLENAIEKIYPERSILREVHRIAHRQFSWQIVPDSSLLARYYRLFSTPALSALIQNRLGLTPRQLYLAGLAFTGVYLDQFAVFYPPSVSIPGLTQSTVDAFVNVFARDLQSIRRLMVESQEFSANYAYAYNPLRAYPLIHMTVSDRHSIVAPIPTLLVRRFTEGIYYELCPDPAFSNPFGESFQSYAGEVIQRANYQSRYRVFREEEYAVGRNKKRTTDWIIEDDTGVFFVETKTKRLMLRAKTDITSPETLVQELDKMAGFVVQVYKTLADCRAGYYPTYALPPAKKVFPVILTLEDWYAFGPMVVNQLDGQVRARLREAGLDDKYADEAPFSICSIADFELLMQVVAQHGITAVLGMKTGDPELREWAMWAFLHNRFNTKDFTRNLFPEVLGSITDNIPEVV